MESYLKDQWYHLDEQYRNEEYRNEKDTINTVLSNRTQHRQTIVDE